MEGEEAEAVAGEGTRYQLLDQVFVAYHVYVKLDVASLFSSL